MPVSYWYACWRRTHLDALGQQVIDGVVDLEASDWDP